MKIAILADLHLSDNFTTVKGQVLDWAVTEVRKIACDLVCCIGDMTAQGSREQTAEVLRRLQSMGVPFCSTPGNAELRIFANGETAQAFDIAAPQNMCIVLLNSAAGTPTADELSKLDQIADNAGFLLATHIPPRRWSDEAQAKVQSAMARRAVTAVIAGHSHHDEADILRGLDPDKASGGVPMLTVMSRTQDGSWQRTDHTINGVDPEEWSNQQRLTFADELGISTMWQELEALEFAAVNHIKNVELRMALNDNKELQEAIGKWRKSGGKILSLHLPDLKAADDDGKLAQYARMACKLGCDRVTLHVPKVTAAGFEEHKEKLLKKFADDLDCLLKKNVIIGIENLHTKAGEDTFETRNFGCTIEECYQWIMLLRKRFDTENIGFHLDIGHARNNAPISGKENLSDWYLKMGKFINGWHIHQVTQSAGKFHNHQPMTGFYDKLISLAGLFMAFRAGQLSQAPMFLESRQWADNIKAYQNLIKKLR